MNLTRQLPWHHNVQEYTLLEFASLKQTCPEGVYLSLKPGKPAQWSGVLFVRKGPYAPAVLRFEVSFPSQYPAVPPSVAFISDIFHPLVAPLTTYTYSAGSSGSETVSATDNERLSPGGFSLRHRFPQWFNRSRTSDDLSGTTSRNTSNSYTGTNQQLRDALRPPSKDNFSRESSAVGFSPPRAHSGVILEILQYIKKCFDDESALDTLPLEAAGNLGAWKAWQAYRRTTASATDNVTSTTSETQQDEWSWDGVWEQRVRKGIDNSVAESTLYGGASGGADDQIRFVNVDDEIIQDVKAKMLQSASILR